LRSDSDFDFVIGSAAAGRFHDPPERPENPFEIVEKA
jgi:hypothetical protein